MANTPAKSKSKRKSVSQRGRPIKKKKTVVDENSIKNSQENGSGDNFQVRIREKFEEELKCNICTEILIRPTVLNCSHMFCEYCIIKWKKQQDRCPICRDRIESQIRVLALDVFIEKALEVLTPEETKARATMISQRERKRLSRAVDPRQSPTNRPGQSGPASDDLEEWEEDSEEEAEENSSTEDSSDEDWFSSEENPDDFLLSDSSESEDLSDERSFDRSDWSDLSSEDHNWDPDTEDDSDS